MEYNGISFNKTGLSEAVSSFDEIAKKISDEITKIRTNLETIDTNWKGAEHDSASSDK